VSRRSPGPRRPAGNPSEPARFLLWQVGAGPFVLAAFRNIAFAALERAKALAPIFEELDGKSAREIARILNERRISTPTGAPWSAMTVLRVRQRLLT
jgi:Recombinase